ncbi:serine/threonine-protein kinase [Methylobacterium goesingense]|uniref:Serine/threonine-protein kinase n=1 Tax=Methylobacterium goesingense TaxID=243690 RepID=A0ABV2LBP5_9HYPH|nr:serine/threonine-protein kinase [Methylobacterium goesingense]GJD74803.1 Serine/threonine-protein kinase PknD [Methylobacterium goesingense]
MNEVTVVDPRPRITAGTRLNELYEIDSLIAVGGMGEIYRGHAIETGDVVAIKTIRPEFAGSGPALALFRKEASALHNLHHEAIVRYFVFSIDRTLNLPYLAMEFVEGIALPELFGRGPMEFEALDVLRRRLASGLHVAHCAGIIHRDVSPDNVILPAGDPSRAKIIDFGIARSSLGGQTVIGDGFAGKYSHVSPEQLGLQGGVITPRSDIYSLGLVLAQASLGRAIDMGGSPADVIVKRSTVPDLSGVDPRLRPLLESMLDPDPSRRPESMADVAAWVPPVPPARTQAVPRSVASKPGGRRRASLPIVLAVLGLLLTLAALAAWYTNGFSSLGTGSKPVFAPEVALDETPAPSPGRQPAAAPEGGPPPRQAPTLPSITPPPVPPESASSIAPPVPPPATRPPVATPVPGPQTSAPAPVPPTTITTTPPGTGETVTAPEGPPLAPPEGASSMEQVASYIRGYRGGSCFYLNPLTVSGREAAVEAYGSSTPPFAAFDAAFRAKFGFDAKIQLRQINPPQCPMINLLAGLALQKQPQAPKLNLERDLLRSGDELKGTIDLPQDAEVALLLLDDEGRTHNLAAHVTRKGRAATFALRLQIPEGKPPRAQLLVAVTSRAALGFLNERRGLRTDAVARQIADEAAQPGSPVGVTVRFLKVGG